jgi:hypothetical protein
MLPAVQDVLHQDFVQAGASFHQFIDCNLQLILLTFPAPFFPAGSKFAIAGGAVVAFLAIVGAITAGCYFRRRRNAQNRMSEAALSDA